MRCVRLGARLRKRTRRSEMRLFLVGLLVLAGCATSPETIIEENEAQAPQSSPSRNVEQRPDEEEKSGHFGPCGRTEVVIVKLPDGEILRMEAPLPCDPLWWMKDHGDPPPFNTK